MTFFFHDILTYSFLIGWKIGAAVVVVVHPLRLVPVVAQVAVEAAATASDICNCNNKIQFFFLKFRRRFNTEQFWFVCFFFSFCSNGFSNRFICHQRGRR